ncbi:LOG family protein [Chlamydia sp. 17-3921]|uniref:LOG family protein n=1 Tax=Chlamydia sp. 17-3921 TaxID=2675798 RepID=UPI00191895E2|nr:LOG family protein [Chlamydia sp. 17-3921]
MRPKLIRLFCYFVVFSPTIVFGNSAQSSLKDIAQLSESFIGGHAPWVAIFGSSTLISCTKEYQQAYELGFRLAKEYRTVLTGAGKGVMEAANFGATAAGGISAGIYLPGEFVNSAISENHLLSLPSWSDRKNLMVYGASACVFFPGGLGVLDGVVTTFHLLRSFNKTCPLVFVGREFWFPFLSWLQETFIENYNFIEDLSYVYIVDSAEEASDIIEKKSSQVVIRYPLRKSA